MQENIFLDLKICFKTNLAVKFVMKKDVNARASPFAWHDSEMT
jgi:hypothetical protein